MEMIAMPDVLTHVLAGYILGMLVASRSEWIRAPQVTLVMLGALSPDFMKIVLLVPDETVESVLGLPFSWLPLHTLGGNLVTVAIIVLLVTPASRKRAFLLLAFGAVSHHALDLLLLNASGYAYPVLWPLTEYHPPAGMLYRSSDRWPLVVATALAVVVWQASKRTALWEW